MLIIIALVALCYCGGKLCPVVLRQNKEMLLGVAIGMALCSFMGLRMEGYDDVGPGASTQGGLGASTQGGMAQIAKGTFRGEEGGRAFAVAQNAEAFAILRRMCASGELPPEACTVVSGGDSSN